MGQRARASHVFRFEQLQRPALPVNCAPKERSAPYCGMNNAGTGARWPTCRHVDTSIPGDHERLRWVANVRCREKLNGGCGSARSIRLSRQRPVATDEFDRSRKAAMAELQPSRLPVDAVFFIGFTMTTIVVHMEILAGGRERRVPKVVSHEPQIDLLIRHMRSCAVSQPVG